MLLIVTTCGMCFVLGVLVDELCSALIPARAERGAGR